ncbi:MAG: hypothetical protein ACREJ2_05765 [Planctomycetota bacterium]
MRRSGRLRFFLGIAAVLTALGCGWGGGIPGGLRAADSPPNGQAVQDIPPLQDKSAAQELHPVLVNGDFSAPNAAKTGPLGWDLPDGLSTFWVEETVDGKPVHLWKIDTKVLETEFLARRKAVQAALDAKQPIPPAKPKTPPQPGQQYDCVGGTYGVQIYSEPVKVVKDVEYRLSARVRGPESGKDATGNYFFFPRIFVKGYAMVDGRERVAYKAYLACRLTKADTWFSFERKLHPTKMTPAVQYLRVMIYCYWPLGTYEVQDVKLEPILPAGAPGATGGTAQDSQTPTASPVEKNAPAQP